MVTPQPDLSEVGEAVVVGDLRGRQVAVVVEDRFGFGETVIQVAGRVGLQEKVVVDEGFHQRGKLLTTDYADGYG